MLLSSAASLLLLLQELMEKTAEMNLNLAEMRPLTKSSPTTSSESDKGVDCSSERQERAHKRRRRGKHRRKWKPYSSMTLEEKKEMEAREAVRVAQREASLARKPSAPWNTTQFIMEDHGCNEVSIPTPRASRTLSMEDSLSEEDYYDSPEEELFEHGSMLEQEFESTYREVACERLQSLSKPELVEECMMLERELHTTQDHSKEEIAKLNKEVKDLNNKLEVLQNGKPEEQSDSTQ